MPIARVPEAVQFINYPPPLKLKTEHPQEYRILYYDIEQAGIDIVANNEGSPQVIAANKALQAACLKYAEYPTKANRLAMIAAAEHFISTFNTYGLSSTNPEQDKEEIALMQKAIAQAKTWTP